MKACKRICRVGIVATIAVCASGLHAGEPAGRSAILKGRIDGLRSTRGKILASVWNQGDGFPSEKQKTLTSAEVAILGGQAEVDVEVPASRCCTDLMRLRMTEVDHIRRATREGSRMAWWSSVVSSVAFAIAIAVATFSWPRMRLLSIAVMAWCAAAWAFSRGGFFHDAGGWHAADIPGFLLFGTLMTLPLVAIALGWYGSRAFRGLVESIPLPTLIGSQAYRLAGIVFLSMCAEGLMPPEIGIVAGCADAFIGITALPLAWAVAKNIGGVRKLAVGWNLIGIADFLVSVSMVSLSFVGVLALQPEPVRIGLHPLALISLFQVPLSIAIHLLALRRLMSPG